MRSQMKLSPFNEVAANAYSKMQQGHTIFQQFNCSHCGTKQTMPDANKFYTHGLCEECGQETNIQKDGCNFMMVLGIGSDELTDVLEGLTKARKTSNG